jgi:hypothetical protein
MSISRLMLTPVIVLMPSVPHAASRAVGRGTRAADA